jgi:hypothetical protein
MNPDEMKTSSPTDLAQHIEAVVDDPILALSAIGALRGWLDQREATVVKMARSEGFSWQGIATAVGRSKQAVWEKYQSPADPSDIINS